MTDKNNQIKYDKGFLIVCSCHAFYKNSALILLDSLDEYYPDCKVMVVCPPEWEEEFKIYPQVVEIRTDGPDERRTKLWALQHTVFEKTCYLDADMEVASSDITKVWDLLDENHDCSFTVINPPNGNTTAIYREEGERGIRDNNPKLHLRYHGGFFVWWHNNKHPNSIKAMELWWTLWGNINKNNKFWEDNPQYFFANKGWDQFTWWYIHTKELPELKIQEVAGGPSPEMYRWNWNQYLSSEVHNNLPPIIKHIIVRRDVMLNRTDMFSKNSTKAG
jgi:hypothetical protein